MDTSGDQGQASTSLAQPIPVPSEPNSAVSWASAFQSPEFMLGLQTAVSHVLRQKNCFAGIRRNVRVNARKPG